MSSLALSVLLSLISAVAYAAGAIIQERVAATGDTSSSALVRNGVWWVAVLLNGVGAILHVIALAYGPLSLVQPLGALTIVFALPLAALFVRRGTGATAWRGALMATSGLGGLLALTGDAAPHTLDGPERLLLATVAFGAVAAVVVLARGLRRPVLRGVVLATGAGGAFGMASVFTKTVAVEWTSGSVTSGLPTLLVIAGLAAAGLLLAQAAYRGAGLTAPLATVTVVNPVVAAAVGITLFGEHFRHGAPGTALALACGVLAAGGLVLLTRERLSAERAGKRRTALDRAGDRARHGQAVADAAPGGAGPSAARATAAAPPVGAARGGGGVVLAPAVLVAEPAGPGPALVPHTSSPRLPPGRAVPRAESGAPRRPVGRVWRAGQTLTPPARR
ncbi:DMT family transporter [Streptomyces pratensis]|uniref:DMT family transporter n=1 Tax=Streptomyces pratensis TaxID=1169025 RepID=UPI003AFB81E2